MNGEDGRAVSKQEDDEAAFELCASLIQGLSHAGHLFELFGFLMKTLDGFELDGFAEHLLGIRNINPKDAMNPKWAYMASTPAFAKVAPMAAAELEARGIAERVRQRVRQPAAAPSLRGARGPSLRPWRR